jgi:pimeloyl-ACP methyl ester carboxylesterase
VTQKPAWLLLHGSPLGPEIWRETANHLRGVVYMPDCTRIPSGPDPQAAFAAQLADRFKGDLHIVGHSFGGQTAIELALLLPDRVRSLSLVCTRDTPFPAFAAVATSIRGQAPSN